MAVKESNLVVISEADFSASDYVRVLDGGSSRNITLTDFGDAISPILTALGFGGVAGNINVVTTASNYNITVANHTVICDTSGGAIGVNLPTTASAWTAASSESQMFTIKRKTTDTNKVTVTPSGVETIDGNTAYDLLGPSQSSISVVTDGTSWFVVAS